MVFRCVRCLGSWVVSACACVFTERVDAHAAAPGVMAIVSWNLGLESELLIWELGSEIRGLRSGV